MDTIIFTLLGITIGTLTGLVPGLHSNLILLLIAGIYHSQIGPTNTAILVASSVGTSLYTHRLSFTFHPVASSNLDSLDPAIRLMKRGKGKLSIYLMIAATNKAIIIVGILSLLVIGLTLLLQIDVLRALQSNIKPLAILVILSWIAYTIYRSGSKAVLTFIGFCLTGTFGYYVLHHEATRSDQHNILILLTSLIVIRMLTSTILDKKGRVPRQISRFELKEPKDLSILGALIGASTGFLAGLGSSSIVSLFQNKAKTDEDYVYLSTAAESANAIVAIILMMIMSLGRSGEAVLLGRLLPNPEPFTIMLIAGCLITGLLVGATITKSLIDTYVSIAQLLPTKLVAIFILFLSLATLTLVENLVAVVVFTIIGVLISIFCHKAELPNQVTFGCLTIPVIIYYLGLVPVVNTLLHI